MSKRGNDTYQLNLAPAQMVYWWIGNQKKRGETLCWQCYEFLLLLHIWNENIQFIFKHFSKGKKFNS